MNVNKKYRRDTKNEAGLKVPPHLLSLLYHKMSIFSSLVMGAKQMYNDGSLLFTPYGRVR